MLSLWLLANALLGKMSTEEPRPQRPEFVEHLAWEIPSYSEQHLVKPGPARWVQLCDGYGATMVDACNKLEYDLRFVRSASFSFDLGALPETLEKVPYELTTLMHGLKREAHV